MTILSDERDAVLLHHPRWGTLAIVVGLHFLAILGLIQAFAPDLPRAVVERAASLVTVEISPPALPEPSPAPQPEPEPEPEEGTAAPEAPRTLPNPVSAPAVLLPIARPTAVPPLSAEGDDATAGAGARGEGTGVGGEGSGTGGGNAGNGRGGVIATSPVKIAGDINDARDYPVPPGGREIRRGHHVIVHMTVGIDGRARDCRIISPSPDPEADRITCRLAEERFRFRPALNDNGDPVPAPFGWRQEWF